jgi:DNA-directed RNA polymerase specialized sigma24 family protein
MTGRAGMADNGGTSPAAADMVGTVQRELFRLLTDFPGRARLSPSTEQAEARLMLAIYGAANCQRDQFLYALSRRGLSAAEIAKGSGLSLTRVKTILTTEHRRAHNAANR